MGFLSICTALYDYTPQGEGELAIREGELVYVLEKGDDDDWWKAKTRAGNEQEDEPVGLIPNNYVEETKPIHQAKALYDYSRQTDEELSFSEDATLLVYDTSDPDWTLVGTDEEFGFAPANYIEIVSDAEADPESESDPISPPLPARPAAPAAEYEPPSPPPPPSAPNPAANLASIIGGQAMRTPLAAPQRALSPAAESDEEETPPPMPQRPVSQVVSPPPQEPSPVSPDYSGIVDSPPANRVSRTPGAEPSAGGYHLYNVNEMVSIMGKQKKMPTTLGINLATGVILIIPEKKRDGPQQEWTADKLTHYSIEGKHVFMELVKPSKSLDLHAGAKDTATEIVGSLGELAGAARAEGLREVIAAGSGKGPKKGQMLYDFMAQGEDEVTVADGDEVIILDDALSEEWWKVRRVSNGKEGVVPSSYVEITGAISPAPQSDPTTTSISAGLSSVEQNRREEERLAREALAASRQREQARDEQELRAAEVGPGLKLPNRGSSLMADDHSSSQRNKRDSRMDSRPAGKSKPDTSKIRTWTDRSGSFKVEAQFIGLKDGKIHLHKVNGVKIAVPVVKMATADLEYVERVTGVSLDEDKPLSDIKKRNTNGTDRKAAASGSSQQPAKPDYDWFDFFLKCGVNPYQCERYSQNFNKDSMDESVLPGIEPTVLRNLGLKEGDVLRVMKYIDGKYGAKSKARNVSFGGEEVIGGEGGGEDGTGSGGLFSGPGGTLLNNTRKGRPAPVVQTNDTIDSKVFEQGAGVNGAKSPPPRHEPDSPEDKPPPPPAKDNRFDDNAWDVKPARSQSVKSPTTLQPPIATSVPANKPTSPPPALTGGMADLSLLSQPLQPVIGHTTGQAQQTPTQATPAPMMQPQLTAVPTAPQIQQPQTQQQQTQSQQQAPQQQGANPAFFTQINQQPTGLLQQQSNTFAQPNQQIGPQATGQFQFNAPRQRPLAPQMTQQGTLMAPPPTRPLSAPQHMSPQSNFQPPALQAQLTGVPNQYGSMNNTSSPPTLSQMQQMNQPPQQFSQPTGFNQGPGYGQGVNGFAPQPNGFAQGGQLQPQATSFQPAGFSLNPQPTGAPFNNYQIQSQPTAFSQNSNFGSTGLQPQQTGINTFLPPALQPQSTGVNGFGGPGSGQQAPSMPQIPQLFSQPPPPIPQQAPAPLQPQKTGPAPNVKFGVQPEAKKMMPQATGRKANLAHATPNNPFGF